MIMTAAADVEATTTPWSTMATAATVVRHATHGHGMAAETAVAATAATTTATTARVRRTAALVAAATDGVRRTAAPGGRPRTALAAARPSVMHATVVLKAVTVMVATTAAAPRQV